MGKWREDPKTPFGWYLRNLMDSQGFESDAELERASGVAATMLSKWQSGGSVPQITSLRRVAPHLGVRLCDLLVEADLATPEELGMEGPTAAPPPAQHQLAGKLNRFLLDESVPERTRRMVEDNVENLLGVLATAKPLPKEPSAAERAAGRRVTR